MKKKIMKKRRIGTKWMKEKSMIVTGKELYLKKTWKIKESIRRIDYWIVYLAWNEFLHCILPENYWSPA